MKTLTLGKQNEQLARFSSRMHKMVVGQPSAIEKVTDSFSRLIAGIHDPAAGLAAAVHRHADPAHLSAAASSYGLSSEETGHVLLDVGCDSATTLDALIDRFALDEREEHSNVILRVVDGELWPFAAGERFAPWPVVAVDPERALVVRSESMPAGTYAFVLDPVDEHTTRLLVRDRASWKRAEWPWSTSWCSGRSWWPWCWPRSS